MDEELEEVEEVGDVGVVPPIETRPRGGAGRAVIWVLVLGAIGAAAAYGWWHFARASEANAKKAAIVRPEPVVASKATRGDMSIYLTGLGSVTALNTVTVRTRVEGELVKVAFAEGQLVQQGDLLAEIDPRPFQVMLDMADAALQRDEAQLRNAKINLDRYRSAKDAVSDQLIDTQVATVDQLDAAIRSDKAQIDQAKLQLVYARITAPIGGRIGLRLVDQGNIVRASDPTGLAVITQLQPIAVVFTLPADELPRVILRAKTGEPIVVEAFNRDQSARLASGKLLTWDNQIDPSSGTVKLKAIFPNDDLALFPNQFVNARLLVEVKKDAVLVPAAAVQRSPRSTYVYVIKNDEAEPHDVELGPIEGDVASIESGVAPGDVVVTQGVDKLKKGTKVTLGEKKGSP
jgi:multidrug efflux system membrane fusion protein